jgi:hypothetical protein
MADYRLQPAAKPAGMARAQPWAALAVTSLLLDWTWEMLQAPLYASMRILPTANATWICTVASGGDVLIALFAYGAIAAAVQDRAWLLQVSVYRVAGYVAIGLFITVALEFLSVEKWGRWSYAPSMPRVLGVGLAPLLQWIAVPLATLWIVRRHHRHTAHAVDVSSTSAHRANRYGHAPDDRDV